jgi:hypothetical protein
MRGRGMKQKIIDLLLSGNHTQAQIARRLSVHRVYVNRIRNLLGIKAPRKWERANNNDNGYPTT